MVCCVFVVVMHLMVPQVALRMYSIVVQLLPKVAVMIYYAFVVQSVGTQLLCVWFVLQFEVTELVMVM